MEEQVWLARLLSDASAELYFECITELRVRVCTPEAIDLRTEGILQVPETPITLFIEQTFSILDKKRRHV